MAEASSTSSEMKEKMVILKSSDEQIFEVEEKVAMQSQTIKHMIEDGCAIEAIPIPNVTSSNLAKVIEYCRKHEKGNEKSQDMREWDAEFMKVLDVHAVSDLMLAANYLDINSLLQLCCQTFADSIKDMFPEEVRKTFGIPNDFTPEEEEEIRKENEWAFQ